MTKIIKTFRSAKEAGAFQMEMQKQHLINRRPSARIVELPFIDLLSNPKATIQIIESKYEKYN